MCAQERIEEASDLGGFQGPKTDLKREVGDKTDLGFQWFKVEDDIPQDEATPPISGATI